MKKIFFVFLLGIILTSCKEKKASSNNFIEESVEKLLTIDEISKVEDIISDSSFMEAKGDTVWRRINDKMIRVKVGKLYYLRMETKDGSVTNLTYKYD